MRLFRFCLYFHLSVSTSIRSLLRLSLFGLVLSLHGKYIFQSPIKLLLDSPTPIFPYSGIREGGRLNEATSLLGFNTFCVSCSTLLTLNNLLFNTKYFNTTPFQQFFKKITSIISYSTPLSFNNFTFQSLTLNNLEFNNLIYKKKRKRSVFFCRI